LFAHGVALATLISLGACGSKPEAPPVPTPAPTPATPGKVTAPPRDGSPGIELRVSDGKQGPPAFDRATLAPAKRLSDGEASALLARAKPITTDAADRQDFALRPASQPPPRTGSTVSSTFPAPPSSLAPPAVAAKDLQVLRYMPEGKVPLAPELSVTFSQPMVAVTSQDDAAKVTPVKLTPTPKGRWRWIGTRTILFDPEVRFPQATTFTVEIPAGTRSATGSALARPTKFTFETPAPSLVAHYPSGSPQHLDVPMLAVFDQKIDPKAVLARLAVKADGKAVPVRLLDAAELARDKQLSAQVDGLRKAEQDGRWLAFRATEPLPADAEVTVEIGAGTPSAEGPNTTPTAQHFDFHTYPPLKIERAECGYRGQCPPGTPFVITFNNPLDPDKLDALHLAAAPAIPDVKIVPMGDSITVLGLTEARARYSIAIPAGVTDEFGQTLGKDRTLTWVVTDAVPTFFGGNGLIVVDPSAKQPTLDFFTTGYPQLKVQLYAVTPADYEAYRAAQREMWNHDHPPKLPGKKVFDQQVATQGGPNKMVETHVDLRPALHGGLGHVIAIVEPSPWTHRDEPAPRMMAWVQSTKLGIDAHVDGDNLIAFASGLDTGKAAEGVSLELRPSGTTGTTDATGQATIALSAARTGSPYLIAKRGDDTAFVAEDAGGWSEGGSWFRQRAATDVVWYVTDDRRLYKPGEEVSLKGWLRTIDRGKDGDVGAAQVASVSYKVIDATGNQLLAGTAPVNPAGGFDTRFTLPRTPNLGTATVMFEARGTSYGHPIQIQEFRRPEFEVSSHASQGPFLVGGSGDVTVEAKYFAGGPLAGAAVHWNVAASPTSFTPPNREDYTFGAWTPWWTLGGRYGEGGDDVPFYRGGRMARPRTWTLASTTDATGAHTMHLDFLSVNPARPMSVSATASVVDVNRQQWSTSSALIVHPSSRYVGVKVKRPFVDKGTPFDVDVIGVDLDGKAIPGAKIDVAVVRLDWEYARGKYTTKEVDPQHCAVVAAKDASACSFQTQKGGEYQLTATIIDDQARANQTTLSFWVSGGDQPPAREVSQERVQIIPDKKEYAPGNTAELLVQAPFYPAEGIVSWRRSGIVKSERIVLDGPTKVITVPIADAMTPNLVVQVDLVGLAARADDHGVADPRLPKRPAYAVGTIDLPIPPRQRTLQVAVTPRAAKLSPGEQTQLAVVVTDAAGKPVANAEAAVIVVDEAILALTGATFTSPIDTFYGPRGADTRDAYSRAYVTLARPDASTLAQGAQGAEGGVVGGMAMGSGIVERNVLTPAAAAPGGAPTDEMPKRAMAKEEGAFAEKKRARLGKFQVDADDDGGGNASQAIAIRSNFNPLAAFAPAVHTDAAGRATVELKLPDNLTRYRVIAIAVAGDKQFGKGESAVTARLPLMVRPSPPRFLNFGDTFQLPVVVQNQTDEAMTVRLAVRATNAAITDGLGREVSVPANDRVEVRFPAAAELAGTARFQIVGTSGSRSDAAELALPVWTPATTEAFATYGVIDDGAIAQPVALPGQVAPQFGGLDVTTASTNLQALTDAMLYLVHYPFECAEQRSSRILAIAALKDVLAAFQVKDMPSAAAMTTSVAADLEHLSQMQNSDGGFAFWDRGYPSEPYLTVYVASALGRAQQKGFAVKPGILERAKAYLRDIESHYPSYYGKEIRWAISAYALATRKELGDRDVAKAKRLVAEAGVAKLSMEANGWLLATLAQDASADAERKAIVRHALNKVSETAGAANFTTGYGDGNYLLLASDRRVDAVMLDALIQEQKDLDLIPKLVTGLLAHRTAGRWLNTQENTFALLALDRYFQTYEKTTPDFVARVWLGKDYAGDHSFKGRTTETAAVHIAMKDVVTHDQQALTIQKDGAGRLYYRIGMTYAPASLTLEPADRGFVVERRYEAVDDPQDVTRAADGVWHIKAGARVRVRLTMVNENRRYHVALVDPLPAGLETLNPALATTGPIPQDPGAQQERGAYWWWYGPWYEHQNLRDERVEAFAALLWEGVHKYDYVARATTPGRFVVPPPKAEEMYMPETFGRGASDHVVVE
jgi:uncharacterized protein YfaS (alpha-2-macroglobulin family)